MKKVIVIGSSNVDIIASSKTSFKRFDSTPADINLSWGGVGRNICENLARLGVNPSLMTALGNDLFGERLKQDFNNLKIDYQASKFIVGQSSLYIAFINNDGSLEQAASSTGLIEQLDSEHILKHQEFLNSFDYVVLDANLSVDAIEGIFKYIYKPILVDATSAKKALKLTPFLNKITLLKCNKYEAETLTNASTINRQINAFKQLGVKEIVITQGGKDIYYGDEERLNFQPVLPVERIVDETGAGDAFMSGLIYGKVNGYSLSKSINIGSKLAYETLQVKGANVKFNQDEWAQILSKD